MKNRIRNSQNRIRNSDRELMQMALDALECSKEAIEEWGSYASPYFQAKHNLEGDIDDCQAVIEALRARLAQPGPEAEVCCQEFDKCLRSCTPRGQWIAHVRCGCGDQIMPNDGAECGNCVAARNAVKPDLAQVGEVGVWGESKA